MTEYINKKDLKFLEIPIAPVIQGEQVHYESGFLKEWLEGVPTADVIERSKIDKAIEDSYKKGLTDAWECARKIGNNSQLGLEEMGFDFSELGTYYNPSWWVVFNYDVFKALEILKRNKGE